VDSFVCFEELSHFALDLQIITLGTTRDGIEQRRDKKEKKETDQISEHVSIVLSPVVSLGQNKDQEANFPARCRECFDEPE
jgi:hypothetical protein